MQTAHTDTHTHTERVIIATKHLLTVWSTVIKMKGKEPHRVDSCCNALNIKPHGSWVIYRERNRERERARALEPGRVKERQELFFNGCICSQFRPKMLIVFYYSQAHRAYELCDMIFNSVFKQ